MFDAHTQKKLDAIRPVRCSHCGHYFLLRGVTGTTVRTLKQHRTRCTGEHAHE